MQELQLIQFVDYLKPRSRNAHKGDCGHVLVIGGDVGYSGAVRMSAEAALRVGAGLVSVVTHSEHAKLLNLTRPELMCHNEKDLEDLLLKATVIVLGPGLGRSSWSQTLFNAVINCEKPLVLDADGLNQLAQNPIKKSNWVLTPHPGEAGRLLKKSTEEIQKNRVQAVENLQRSLGGVVVLKGSGSLIATEQALAICTAGNPGMATAGMGDILSGVIGGLIAQGIPLDEAAKLGVLVHAMAGDLAAAEGERGMVAMDLMPYLRRLVNANLI